MSTDAKKRFIVLPEPATIEPERQRVFEDIEVNEPIEMSKRDGFSGGEAVQTSDLRTYEQYAGQLHITPSEPNPVDADRGVLPADVVVSQPGQPGQALHIWRQRQDDLVDDETAWQVRQSPLIMHQRTDVLTAGDSWHCQPQFVKMANGDLRLYTMRAITPPWQLTKDKDPSVGAIHGLIEYKTCRGPSQLWSGVSLAPAMGGVSNITTAFAVTTIPGTDDILLIRAREDGVTVHINNHIKALIGYGPDGFPGTEYGQTDYITDALRAQYASIQVLQRPDYSSWVYRQPGRIYSMRAAFLPSGRLVLVVAEPGGLWSMTSDDYGSTWSRHLISYLYDAVDVWDNSNGDPNNLYREPEYVDVSLVLAENGNLMLGTVEPSQMGMFCPYSTADGGKHWIRSYTTSSVRDTASMNVRLLCSSDGASWGGGKVPFYDYSAYVPFNGFVYRETPEPEYRPGRGYLYRRYAATIIDSPVLRDDTWEFDGSYLGYTFDPTAIWGWPLDVNEFPGKEEWFNAQHTYPYWDSLPMHISLSLSPDGFLDVHLTTAPAWDSDEVNPDPEHPTLTLDEGEFDPPPDEDQDKTLQYARFSVDRPVSGRCKLLHRRFSTRTPRPGDSVESWMPITGNQTKLFHPVHPVTSSCDTVANQIAGYNGGLATVAWRGSTLLATQLFSYTKAGEDIDAALGLCVWRLNGWQPLVERLGWWERTRNIDSPQESISRFYDYKGGDAETEETAGTWSGGAIGRTYTRSWSAGVLPQDLGWFGGDGGGASSEIVPNSVTPTNYHSGHMFQSVPPGGISLFATYPSPTVPIESYRTRLNGSLRILCGPQSGASVFGTFGGPIVRFSLWESPWTVAVALRIYSDTVANKLSISVSAESTDTDAEDGPEIVLDPDSAGSGRLLEFLISVESTLTSVANELSTVRVYWRYVVESQPLDALGQPEAPGSFEMSDLSDYLNQFHLVYEEDEYQLDDGGSGPELLSFGVRGSDDTEGPTITWRWKHVYLHRPLWAPTVHNPLTGNPAVDPQQMYSLTYDSDARNGFLSNRGRAWASDMHRDIGSAQFDSLWSTQAGIINFPMGASIATKTPVWLNQYYAATATGPLNLGQSWRIDPTFLYDETNIWRQPTRREWRWTPQYAKYGGDDLRADMTFDVAEGVRPGAWVVIGRNTPTIDLRLIVDGGVDTLDNTCVRAFVLGITDDDASDPMMTGSHRYAVNTAIWSSHFDVGSSPGATQPPAVRFRFARNHVYAYAESVGNAAAFWMPHRFASEASGGAQYYVAFQLRSSTYFEPRVFRIVDNTYNRLQLEGDVESLLPSDWLNTHLLTMAIYSDRFAIDLRDMLAPLGDPSDPAEFDAAAAGAPITRVHIRFGATYFEDTDAAFHRCGRMVLGSVYDLSSPDVDWDWNYTLNSGTALVRTPDNAVFASTNSAPYHSVTTSFLLQSSAPMAQNKLGTLTDPLAESWERTVAMLQRLALDGREAVLLWQGALFPTDDTNNPAPVGLGALASALWTTHAAVAGDPTQILMVRAGGPIQVVNQSYRCRQVWRDGSLVTIPLPEAKVGQLTFTEEF